VGALRLDYGSYKRQAKIFAGLSAQQMNRFWSLRDEYYRLFHRWPTMVAFFALGCLLGGLLSYLWPSYFKASRDIYVGLNAYRTYSDTSFLALAKPRYANIDNYHYWQMNQLNTILSMDSLLQETLDELRMLDPYWVGVDIQELRDRLDTDWRTAGAWSLNVSHPDRERASQALEVWSKIAVKRVQSAVGSARSTFMIDQELEQTAKDLFAAQQRQQTLTASQASLEDWLEFSTTLPQDQPLSPVEKWRVFSVTSALALDDPAWSLILESQPDADAAPDAYHDWASQVLAQIDLELAALPSRIAALEQERAALEEQYSAESALSLGLSPNIEIEQFGTPNSRIFRPTTTLILVGGFLGLLLWLLIELVKITRRVQARE
jgi:hypothetical protein